MSNFWLISCWLLSLLISYSAFAAHSNQVQTLTYVVKHTLHNNPNVLQKQANIKASEAALNAALGGYAPNIDVRFAAGSNGYYHEDVDNDFTDLMGNRTGFLIIQPVFSGLSTYNLAKQRRYEIKTTKYQEAYTKELLALAAINAYMDVLRYSKLRVLAAANVRTHQKTLADVKTLYKGGAGRKSSLDLAKGRLSQSKATQHNITELYQNAVAEFINVVGFAPRRLRPTASPRVPSTLTTVQNIALQIHPALQAAKKITASTQAAVAVSKGRLFPTIDIEASANNSYNMYGDKGWDKDRRAMVVANYNLFRGGSDIATVHQTQQQHIAAWQNQQDVKRQVIETTTTAWDALQADRSQLPELQVHVIASKQVLQGYREQFKIGRRTLLDVLNTENELFSSQISLVNAQYALKVDAYSLLASMGTLAKQF